MELLSLFIAIVNGNNGQSRENNIASFYFFFFFPPESKCLLFVETILYLFVNFHKT